MSTQQNTKSTAASAVVAKLQSWTRKALADAGADGMRILVLSGVSIDAAQALLERVGDLAVKVVPVALFGTDEPPAAVVELARPPVLPADVACPTCGAGPGSSCDPRGGSYEHTGMGLAHAARVAYAREVASGHPVDGVVAGAGASAPAQPHAVERIWCGVHQCWDDECTQRKPPVISNVISVGPPAGGVFTDTDHPLDGDDAGDVSAGADLNRPIEPGHTEFTTAELSAQLDAARAAVLSTPATPAATVEPAVEQPKPAGQ